jgi:hypothetical protein
MTGWMAWLSWVLLVIVKELLGWVLLLIGCVWLLRHPTSL